MGQTTIHVLIPKMPHPVGSRMGHLSLLPSRALAITLQRLGLLDSDATVEQQILTSTR
jgi:hypothetical protein